MASLVHPIVSNYNEIMESRQDPVVDSWVLMGSPIPLLCILAAYLVFVLKLGPKMMENRPAFQLKSVMILYNGIQVIFSVWLSYKVFRTDFIRFLIAEESTLQNGSILAATQLAVSTSGWWYHFAKITELLDTVFFVLRKKQNQVSFLHVYHHSVMVLFTWIWLKMIPGGQAVVVCGLNCVVHIIMYSYYFIAALGPAYQKYLWWKRYMTTMQLTQFGLILCYLMYLLCVDSSLPKPLTYFFLTKTTIFLYLFVNFYKKTYKRKTV